MSKKIDLKKYAVFQEPVLKNGRIVDATEINREMLAVHESFCIKSQAVRQGAKVKMR